MQRTATKYMLNGNTELYDDSTFKTYVTKVRHFSEKLFEFEVSRPSSFRFRSGEFVMIGIVDTSGAPILRPYSIASPYWADTLSFLSIVADGGVLTPKLRELQNGQCVLLKRKAVGTLVLDAVLPSERLYLIATGTGVAPFASLVRDPEIYEKDQEVFLIHTCRNSVDLEFSKNLIHQAKSDILLDGAAIEKLKYYPTTTRENSPKVGRATNLIKNQSLFDDLGTPYFNPEHDSVMVCGSLNFNHEIKDILLNAGFSEGSNASPGHFVTEKAFVG